MSTLVSFISLTGTQAKGGSFIITFVAHRSSFTGVHVSQRLLMSTNTERRERRFKEHKRERKRWLREHACERERWVQWRAGESYLLQKRARNE